MKDWGEEESDWRCLTTLREIDIQELRNGRRTEIIGGNGVRDPIMMVRLKRLSPK